MRKKVIPICILLIMLAGVGLLSYPSLANYINNKNARSVIGDYQAEISNLDAEKLQSMMAQAYAYNNSLPGAFPANPFSGENISKQAAFDYQDFFMIQKDAMIGYIEIPSLDIYLPIYYGTSDEVLEKGVGLIENSSLPVGGESSHAVLSAHTGLPTQELFTGLEELESGDVFFIHVLDQVFAYRVNQSKVVEPKDTRDLMIEKDHTYVTLLTCTPYGINSHRLLVRGELDKDYDVTAQSSISAIRKQNDWLWMVALASVAMSGGGFGAWMYRKRKKGAQHEEPKKHDEN